MILYFLRNLMERQGWLFDLYPLDSSMILWIKEEDGCIRRFEEPFRPRFYAQGKRGDLFAFLHSFQKARRMTGWQWTRRREFWSGNEVEVMEIELGDPSVYIQLPRILSPWEERVTFYNCDVPLPQAYLYEKGIFPTGKCIVEVEGNRIFKIYADPSESVWVDDGGFPDLRVMELRTNGDSTYPPCTGCGSPRTRTVQRLSLSAKDINWRWSRSISRRSRNSLNGLIRM